MQYLILILLMTVGCSGEMAKRTTYETLENMRLQRCVGNPSANCSQREGYDAYTRKREEVVK